eukprot:TRINITY_DN14662_c0_g1_i1.p1 TRINITY_DN14662_c0_g1~~TRINITY_DN14662_c0_g1_i1.p1  ORF type:complete len:330 (+),score=81.81 TRINITY_DN14662_c0_g1_i1:61-1050(+)
MRGTLLALVTCLPLALSIDVAVLVGGRLKNSSITNTVEIFAPNCRESAYELPPFPRHLENILLGYIPNEGSTPGGILLACGGGLDDYASRECFRYFPRARVWIFHSQLNVGRHNADSVVSDGNFIIVGGNDEESRGHSSMEILIQKEWLLNPEKIPSGGRRSHCVAKVNQGFILAGGLSSSNHELRSAYYYNVTANTWERIQDMQYPREWHSCVGIESNGYTRYVLSGGASCCVKDNSLEVYDLETKAWSFQDAGKFVLGRDGSKLLQLNGNIYALGGRLFYDSVEMYDPELSTRWKLMKDLKLLNGRRFAGVAKVPLEFFEGEVRCEI